MQRIDPFKLLVRDIAELVGESLSLMPDYAPLAPEHKARAVELLGTPS